MIYKCSGQSKTIIIDQIPRYDQKCLYYFKECIIKCIQHHQKTLKLAEDIENTFNLMLLVQFLGCLSAYSIQLYQLSLVSTDKLIWLICGD